MNAVDPNVERAAGIITDSAVIDWAYIGPSDQQTMYVENSVEIAQALADADPPLLVTAEIQAVLDAVEVWFGDAVGLQEAAAGMWAAWRAYLASREATP